MEIRQAPSAGGASRWRALGLAIGITLVATLLTRLLLLAMHPPVEGARGAASAIAAGSVLDVRAALWLAAPFALWIALLPERWWHARAHGALVRAAFVAALALAIFTAVAELLFFDEFNGRFNFVAVDYLVYPTEVATNLGESYPVPAVLAAVAAAALLAYVPLRRVISRALHARTTRRARAIGLAAYAVALAALTIGVPSTVAHVSDDRALNEIAADGYDTFWLALRGQDAPYRGLYATRPSAQVFPRLRALLGAGRAGAAGADTVISVEREIAATRPERRLNVVVVLEESLGSELVGALHPRERSLTPRFDSLAREGVLLTHAFSTGNRTIRALEATTASIPPLPGVSIVRRPASSGLFTLPSVLRERGYSTTFVYGGRAMFDGMGGFMRRNGVQRVIDQGDMASGAFTTAWGASDEFIFDRALVAMDSLHARGAPFYVQVLTVSNHKPYTFPSGRITPPLAGRHRENAVHYADWALGRFVRDARGHAWFDSTIFVLMGDHGARVYGAAEIPLASYEVPILLYAPRLLAPREVPTLASSLDVPPTLLALLGGGYASKFFGQDVLAARPEDGRALMTHNSEIALMRGDMVAVLGLRGATALYRRGERDTLVPIRRPDAAERRLVEDAIAYYDGADCLYRSGAYDFAERRPVLRCPQ